MSSNPLKLEVEPYPGPSGLRIPRRPKEDGKASRANTAVIFARVSKAMKTALDDLPYTNVDAVERALEAFIELHRAAAKKKVRP